MSFFCIACVSTGEMGIIESCGEFSTIAAPGATVFCWPVYNLAGRITTRVQQLMVPTSTKTRDNVTVTVMIAVQFRVINEVIEDTEPIAANDCEESSTTIQPMLMGRAIETSELGYTQAGTESHGVWRAYYRLTDVKRQLTPYVEDVVRSEVPRKTLDEAYESKDDLATAVKSALQVEMQRYGYEIVNALVTDLQPDQRVLDAMNQIEAQRRMRMASQEKAEAEKILVVKAAEADAESKEHSGMGVARQRQAIVDGLKESVLQFSGEVNGATPSDVMQLMMVTQYLDMLKDVGTSTGAETLFIPHSAGAVADVQAQMRQGFLEANAVGA